VQPRGPREFADYVKAEADKWGALIKARKLQLD
jgi:tripartite-type tricarboxylate transporter receptor subunit TctC